MKTYCTGRDNPAYLQSLFSFRTAVGKAKRGGLRFYRPDDLAVDVIKGLLASVPQLDVAQVDDVIVGNAVPEAEQCGWCTDKFGVTWQIVPRILDEMMRDPQKAEAVTAAFMPMKKIDLETIKKAGE